MKTKIFLGMLLVGVVPLRAQDYYVVTKENVDVYQYPAAGEVVGKVGTMNSFTAWEAGDGWMEFKTPVVSGCVPAKYLRKTAHGEFSRAMLGDYIGKAPAPVSYSTATLSEKEGYVVLQLTDFVEPDSQGGQGSQASYVYVGVPRNNGVTFTHSLYPYVSNESLALQVEGSRPLREPYEFVVAEGGVLRAYDRLLEVQQSLHREDVPVAERNLFQLRGNVKEVGYVRAYRDDFLKTMDKDTNGSHPLRNMFKSLSFSPDDNLAVYENYDGNMKLIEKYIFASDGSDVLAEGERNGQPFRAAYTRKEGNFGITYRGSYEDGESGHGLIECDYALNMNGVPFNITHSRNAPPFVDFGDGERYDITYRYRQDGSLPSAMSFRFGYGGKSWEYKDAEIKEVKTDSCGNWTERVVFVNGVLFFKEKQTITYY